MALDNFVNFGKVTLSTGYDASATSIVLTSGGGAILPTAPFNAVWYNSTDYGDPTDDPNVEIIRVTVKSTNTLTITRAQESTTAKTHNTSAKTYKLVAGLTAKTFNTDILDVDNFIDNEIVSGSNTTFTLANTPIAGSVHLYGDGQRLTPGAGNDYTISTATITILNGTYTAGSILADYRK